jgi:DNA replication factor GINS
LLRKIQSDERAGSALSRLPDEFYPSVQKKISEARERLNRNFSLADAKEFENTLKVLRDIFMMREQKMLLRALAAAGGARDGSALTSEEKEAFDKIVVVLEQKNRWFEGLLEGKEKADAEEGEGARMGAGRQSAMHVRFLVPIPTYVGSDGKSYGPYKAGELAELPEAEANLLVRRKAAEAT